MAFTTSDWSRVRALATRDWHTNPNKSYEKVTDDAARSVKSVRVSKPVEMADSENQADWFDVGSAVMATRAELIRNGGIRGLVDQLKALVSQKVPARTRWE